MTERDFIYGLLNNKYFTSNFAKFTAKYLANSNEILTKIFYSYYYVNFNLPRLIDLVFPFKPSNSSKPENDELKAHYQSLVGELMSKNAGNTIINNKKRVVFDNRGLIYDLKADSQNNSAEAIEQEGFKKSRVIVAKNMIYVFGLSDEQRYIYRSRFYLMIKDEYRQQVTERIVLSLDQYNIPFSIKLVLDYSGYDRNDKNIIYTNPSYCNIVLDILKGLFDEIPDLFEQNKHLNFAYRIHPWLFFGESPVNGNSFGMHRSNAVSSIVSNGILSSGKFGVRKNDYNLIVDSVLKLYGINPDYFALNEKYQHRYYGFIR